MKIILLPILAVAALFGTQAFAGDTDGIRPVWDFVKKAPVYGYEKWKDLGEVGTKTGEGWKLDGPAAGGFGIVFNDLLDLESAARFHVKVIPNGSNTGERLMFKFHAADGKQAIWYVPISGLQTDTEADLSFDLTKPDELVGGEKPDMGIIKQIQVQGTFNPTAKIQLTFVSFGVEPKP